MPQKITDVDLLQRYLIGVLDRANHHASSVNEICLAIAGAIIWKKSNDIRVLEREGEMKNVLWVDISGHKYAFTYNHEAGTIDVKENSVQGNTLASFSNENSLREIKDFFENL